MKTLTYEREKIKHLANLLCTIPLYGFQQASAMKEIGDILDSGIPGEIAGMEGGGINDSNRSTSEKHARTMEQNICENKLEESSINGNGVK